MDNIEGEDKVEPIKSYFWDVNERRLIGIPKDKIVKYVMRSPLSGTHFVLRGEFEGGGFGIKFISKREYELSDIKEVFPNGR